MRVLIQRSYAPNVRSAVGARSMDASVLPELPGLSVDTSYSPVQIPAKEVRRTVGDREVGRLFTFNSQPEASTYLVRGEVENEAALATLMAAADASPDIVGVFSDPQIVPILVCPGGSPVGNHRDVENLLSVPQLQSLGMTGANVYVAIVDTGVNMAHLRSKGKMPNFDASRSWGPFPGLSLGSMPVDHGTMCGFDVCIAAPQCTLLDYALLQSQAQGGSSMDGFLSDAVKAFSQLLTFLMNAPAPKPALVVNNSWGMFHPSWDFPVGNPGNYSDNPNHPFNIIVESLEDAGADILFAAGNCGADCPDSRCQGVTSRAIYGANSHGSVLCIAGTDVTKQRVGYSSQGPGRLVAEKPDFAAYTHFVGSGVYPEDGGTSAACPVAAGVVAAIRSIYPPSQLTPAQLRQLLKRTAEDVGTIGFDYNFGAGIINVPALLGALNRTEVAELTVNGSVSGTLAQMGDKAVYRANIGIPLTIELDGPTGSDFDLYIRRGAEPTLSTYDYRGYTASPDEKLKITATDAGEYFVMVHAYQGSGAFTLKAY